MRNEYSKFFWIESGSKEDNKKDISSSGKIRGKNINTGANYGKIGDN